MHRPDLGKNLDVSAASPEDLAALADRFKAERQALEGAWRRQRAHRRRERRRRRRELAITLAIVLGTVAVLLHLFT